MVAAKGIKVAKKTVVKSVSATKSRAKRGEQVCKMDALGIDALCERIEKGESVGQIADALSMPRRTVWNWINADVARAVRARESLRKSAFDYDDKAEEVLKSLKPEASQAEIARARELAQHYRWRASKRNPKDFGDKLDLNHGGEVKLTDDQLNARLALLLGKAGIAGTARGK